MKIKCEVTIKEWETEEPTEQDILKQIHKDRRLLYGNSPDRRTPEEARQVAVYNLAGDRVWTALKDGLKARGGDPAMQLRDLQVEATGVTPADGIRRVVPRFPVQTEPATEVPVEQYRREREVEEAVKAGRHYCRWDMLHNPGFVGECWEDESGRLWFHESSLFPASQRTVCPYCLYQPKAPEPGAVGPAAAVIHGE